MLICPPCLHAAGTETGDLAARLAHRFVRRFGKHALIVQPENAAIKSTRELERGVSSTGHAVQRKLATPRAKNDCAKLGAINADRLSARSGVMPDSHAFEKMKRGT
jgi:hypothetical protein